MRSAFVLGGILLVPLLAGCLAPATVETPLGSAALPETIVMVDDAQGDAYEPSTADAHCGFCPLPDAARRGTPAPYFDVVAATVADAGDDALVLSLSISDVAEGFPELDKDEAGYHRIAYYYVCLGDDEDLWGCATLLLTKFDGRLSADGTWDFWREDCNAWAWCSWEVPVAFVPGSPATVTFTVPKAYVAWGVPARTITTFDGGVVVGTISPALSAWHAAYSVHAPGADAHDHPGGIGGTSGFDADYFEADVDFTVVAPRVDARPALERPVVVAAEGNLAAHGGVADKPEIDILSIDMEEDGSDLLVTFTVASYDRPSFDHILVLAFGTTGDPVWEVGYLQESVHGGYGFAGRCITFTCAGDTGSEEEHDMSHATSVVVDAQIVPGTPGILRVRAPMATFPSIQAGDVTTIMFGITAVVNWGVWFGELDDEVHGDVHMMSVADRRIGGVPYVFTTGAPAMEHPHASSSSAADRADFTLSLELS